MEQFLGGPRGPLTQAVDRICAVLGAASGLPAVTDGAGAVAGTLVTVSEARAIVQRTLLTLAATPITLTDDAGVGQWGTLKVYDMPAGDIILLGAVIDADITLNETWWADAATGNVGLGTAAAASGITLATTKQNIVPTTVIAALAAQVGPIDAQSTGVLATAAAAGTDTDVILNVRIDDDAAHMPDVVTNGGFGSDTGWTKGTGWTIGTGKGTSDASQSANSDISQAAAGLVPGVAYTVAFTTSSVTGGTIRAVVNGTLGTVRSTSATFTETIIAGASGGLALRADLDFAGSIDNVSVVPQTGTGVISGTIALTWANLGDID